MNLASGKHTARILLFSFGAAAICSAVALFVVFGTLRGLGWTVAAAMIYMTPLMLLQALTEKRLVAWADAAHFPFDWMIYGGAKLVFALTAAAVGSCFMMILGIVGHWQDLYLANRMVVVVSVVIACLIRLYSSTKNRLEARNLQLEERVQAEGRTLELHQQDFERAREIQEALMPKTLPQIPGYQLAAGCRPARMVSGDYYDVIRLGDVTLGVVIADVCGKGMAAALLMSNLQAIVRAFAAPNLAPRELCVKANQLIAANVAPGKFITFFYGVLDGRRMRFDYCNAGHNPPLLRRRNGALESLREGGPVLGVFPEASYSDGSVELRPGDRLVLFTDGVTEATNGQLEEFGEERLRDLAAHPAGNAEECRLRIMTAVTEFSGESLADDATLLVVAAT
jgi:sigma-B regulation protein RsbU (phosphoserine phosphatase)